MSNETKIEDIYFPNNNFKAALKFPEVLKILTNYDYESLDSLIKRTDWNIDDTDYSLVKEALLHFNEALRSKTRISQNDIKSTYTKDFADNFAELGRYFLLLYETYSDDAIDFVLYFVDYLLCLSLEVSDTLVSNLEGYPDESIQAIDWLSAVTVIEWLELVFSFYSEQHSHTTCFNIRLCQLKLTIAAKGHYPDEVAWAMYNLGMASEIIDNKEGAINCYQALVNDFSFVLKEEKAHENEYLYEKVEASLEKLKTLKELSL